MLERLTEEQFRYSGGFEQFDFQGRKAGIVYPERMREDAGWAMYTEYFGVFPYVAEALLKRGFCIVHFENTNRWGTDTDIQTRWAFADFLEQEKHLSHRCIPIGMSLGGLHAIKFAFVHPERIAALYLDAPVVNLLSCPFAYGTAERQEKMVSECMQALSLAKEEDILSYREHPLDFLPGLVQARIPVAMAYGDADTVVPYPENGVLIEKLWMEAGIPLLVCGKPGCGHHPHGPDDPEEFADFLERWTNA